MTINIEITKTPDVKKLASIHAKSFGNNRAWKAEDIQTILSMPKTAVFLVQDYTGFALMRVMADEAEILTLAVLPEFQRQGLGNALVNAMKIWAKEQQAQKIYLEVRVSNAAAQNLYKVNGFSGFSRLRGDYYQNADGSFEDAMLMGCAL